MTSYLLKRNFNRTFWWNNILTLSGHSSLFKWTGTKRNLRWTFKLKLRIHLEPFTSLKSQKVPHIYVLQRCQIAAIFRFLRFLFFGNVKTRFEHYMQFYFEKKNKLWNFKMVNKKKHLMWMQVLKMTIHFRLHKSVFMIFHDSPYLWNLIWNTFWVFVFIDAIVCFRSHIFFIFKLFSFRIDELCAKVTFWRNENKFYF